MRRLSAGLRRRRTTALGAVCGLTALTVLLVVGCSGEAEVRNRPVAVLAESRRAQRDFRAIQQHWVRQPDNRGALEGALLSFLRKYPKEPLVRRARVYLAWIYVEQGAVERGRGLAREARGSRGSVDDFAVVVEAAALIREGLPKRALALLRPLRGKIVDPEERLLFGEQLVRAALAAGSYDEAVRALADWLAEAPSEERDVVRRLARQLLESVPVESLERSLSRFEVGEDEAAEDDLLRERRWLASQIRDYLAQWALDHKDASLAGRLLEAAPRRARYYAELRSLVFQGTPAPRIAGRSLGFVASLSSVAARHRSMAVAMGLSRSLDLAHSRSGRTVRLLMREERGEAQQLEAALAALAGDGAAILVAVVDAKAAKAALRFSRRERIAVVLLTAANEDIELGSHGFLLGAGEQEVRDVLTRELQQRGATRLARVGSLGGEGQVSCDRAARRAGAPRFPVEEWRRGAVQGVLLLGDEGCSLDVLRETRAAGLSLVFGVGLDAGPAALRAKPGWAVSAGAYPLRTAAGEQAVWRTRTGSAPSWFEALGHDAAVLAKAALAKLPEASETRDTEAVAELHERARQALLQVEGPLWTTDAAGFRGSSKLPRRLQVVPTRKLR